jgi:thiol:disulfide interchange protein
MRFAPTALVASLSLLALIAGARAQGAFPADDGPKVHAEFIAEQPEIRPSETVTIALRETIREGWHTYWRNPGDSGAPTFINWQLPDGWTAGEIQWPYPERMPIGPLMNYGYEEEVVLLVDIRAPESAAVGESITIPADVGWLVCSDVCIPEDTYLELQLGISDTPAPPTADNERLFSEARSKLPIETNFASQFEADDARFAILIENSAFAAAPPQEAVFYPFRDGVVEPPAEQKFRTTSDGLILETQAGWEISDPEKRPDFGEIGGIIVVTSAAGQTEAFSLTAMPGIVPIIAAAPVVTADIGLITALLFAFLGGLILNLMPCVLPVLSMKALALAKKSGEPEKAHRESLAYAAGVFATFALLALTLIAFRAGGEAVGWGFQLQEPIFVAILALIMFAVGLNLAGLFEVTAGSLANLGQGKATQGGPTGSFFTGMLAVVVATPCTAPFMAAAIGFAATQPAVVSLAVFMALAAGFALPFVALGFSPALLRLFPRPGNWMVVFKQVLAFPMFGAALWLVWVVAQQTGPNGLFYLFSAGLFLSFALWAFGASQQKEGRAARLGMASALIALLLTGAVTSQVHTAGGNAAVEGGALGYEAYDAGRLSELRAAGKPVFVNATAAWCITCLLNERVALSSNSLKEAFDARGIVAMKADWTNQNPEITALLSEYGRNGVPLYLYYAPNSDRAEVLPQLLTESIVLAALDAG